MFELLIDKQIGEGFFTSGITPDYVRGELAKVGANEDVRITINSPGGDLWDCFAIYNIIRDFARNHADIQITTYIQGMAASAASVIALAANSVSSKNKIIAEDNSVFMIHNGWSVVIGDRNDLRTSADAMERLDDMVASVYAKRTGRKNDEIKSLMDAESWYYGKEIAEAGFADEIIDSGEENTADFALLRNSSVIKAQAFVKETQNAIKKNADKLQEQNAKIVACLKMESAGGANSRPDTKNMEGCEMTAEELKKNNPDIYAAIVAEGADTERERASRLLAMGEKCGCVDYALECIKNNSNPTDSNVIDAFMDKKVAANILARQAEDEKNIPDVVTPKDSGEKDNAAIMAAFDKELGRNL